jgi:hypothetical protein
MNFQPLASFCQQFLEEWSPVFSTILSLSGELWEEKGV